MKGGTMERRFEPMVPGRKQAMPCVYGDTPTFLGVPRVKTGCEFPEADVAVMGVPWEGTITWGSYSGCEMTPKTVRHAAARYGGYLPELDMDIFDHLRIIDVGDVSVEPGDEESTMNSVAERSREIYRNGAIPFIIGGDHSFSPVVVKALAESAGTPVGVVHLDSHLDNVERFGEDRYPRCGPLHNIAMIPEVKKSSIVQFGIRGPRNSRRQMEYARELGATVMTIGEIRSLGIDRSVEKAVSLAYEGTGAVYLTICSDVLDAACNPGGPCDFDGLTPGELFRSLRRLGREGLAGFDFVEVYPLQDRNSASSHLVAWAMINALAGMAIGKTSRKM